MFVLWDGAELCDAFQFFCAVILCGDLHGFSNLCRELYAAAYVLRTAILYNNFHQFVLSGAAAFFTDSKGYTGVRFSAVAVPFGC